MSVSAIQPEVNQSQITSALAAESALAAKPLSFIVQWARQVGPVWHLRLGDDVESAPGLHESLEGAMAWWPEPDRGAADVLAVIPEQCSVILRFATTRPPSAGNLFVYPTNFVEALATLWRRPALAERAARWLQGALGENRQDPRRSAASPRFGKLRAGQRAALSLASWRASFLWGPPGTGKTYTLGRILAQHFEQFPSGRVLLLSTTNTAVDQALVAVDDATNELYPGARSDRSKPVMYRVGGRFTPEHFENRRHLLPVGDEQTLRELVLLESCRPEKSDVAAYAAWVAKRDTLRASMRRRTQDVIRASRLAAMTTSLAVLQFEELSELPPFDLIAFDEASQVGIAHALPLASLGARCLFAGDPKQLAPICQSTHPGARRWIGSSMFEYMNASAPWTRMLEEQSRMSEPICRLISSVFYQSKLRVADDARRDPAWLADRTPSRLADYGQAPTILVRVDDDAHEFSTKYNGPIRWSSAEAISHLVDDMIRGGLELEQILIVTPFNAQRRLILEKLGRTKVRISTVQRAQGAERHTVIFDPVVANSEFFREVLDSRRLINVALSRAKARIILLVSKADLQNPLLADIAAVINPPAPSADRVHISTLVNYPNFPDCLVGREVVLSDVLSVRVLRIRDGGSRFEAECLSTGQHKIFHVQPLREKYASP